MMFKFKLFLLVLVFILPAGCENILENADQRSFYSFSVQNKEIIPKKDENDFKAYQLALQDAAVAEEHEIKPLVCLEKNDKRAVFKRDKVLLASWHNVPQIYENRRIFVSEHEAIWSVSAKELDDKIKEDLKNEKNVEKPYIRLCQLVGRSDTHEPYTHISYLLVSPKDVMRPAYQTDASVSKMTVELDENELTGYKNWFEKNQKTSEGHYPWTRLGYTCDWKNGSCEYGLTEFIIKKGAVIEVEKTLTNEAFFEQF